MSIVALLYGSLLGQESSNTVVVIYLDSRMSWRKSGLSHLEHILSTHEVLVLVRGIYGKTVWNLHSTRVQTKLEKCRTIFAKNIRWYFALCRAKICKMIEFNSYGCAFQ